LVPLILWLKVEAHVSSNEIRILIMHLSEVGW